MKSNTAIKSSRTYRHTNYSKPSFSPHTALKMKIVAFSALVLMAFAITTTTQQLDSNRAANNQPGNLKDMIVRPYIYIHALGSTIYIAIAYIKDHKICMYTSSCAELHVSCKLFDWKQSSCMDGCTTLLPFCCIANK